VTKRREVIPWDVRLVREIGAAMKRARGSRSARELSDDTAELGYRIAPTIIAKLDSGHRGAVLSVPELLVLAAALDIPPAMLLFGDGYPGGEVEYLPDRSASNLQAAQWFSGETPLPSADDTASAPNTGVELVTAVRRYADAARNLADQAAWIDVGAEHGEPGDLIRAQLQHQVATLAAQIAKLQNELQKGPSK
jgi:hypothetical protein